MDENFAYWSALFNEQESGSLRPSPLVPMLLPTWPIDSPLTCLAYMIVQDVTAFLLFNPHGGPITHSSTGSKPDSPVHPCCPSYSSCLTSYVIHGVTFLVIYSGIRHKTYYHCSGPLLHFVSGIGWLPTRLKLLMVPSYLLSIFSWVLVRELLSATFPYVSYQIVNLA